MRLTSIQRAIAGARWNPRDAMFGAGEQGVYFDPNDTVTLFQDVAGTIPAVLEGPVGLMLDQSGRGNHAYQSTSAKRATLTRKVNNLSNTEDFSQASWLKNGASVSGTKYTAPNGTLTANMLVESSASSVHAVAQEVTASLTINTPYTNTIRIAKYPFGNSRRWAYVSLVLGSDGASLSRYAVNIDLLSGQVTDFRLGSRIVDVSTVIISDGSFWAVTMTATPITTTNVKYVVIGSSNSASPTFDSYYDVTYSGDGVSGVYIWGADLRQANLGAGIPPYQRVGNISSVPTDYDTSGFPAWLKSSGGQAMVTNSIDFTGTNKVTIITGFRKLSDAATGMLLELSPNVNTNDGSFYYTVPETGVKNRFVIKGSLAGFADCNVTLAATKVVTCLGDIQGDSAIVRLNGSQAAIGNYDQGVGNLGNHQLFLFARNQSSLYFNGLVGPIIIRGAQSSADQISRTEDFVNRRQKVYP